MKKTFVLTFVLLLVSVASLFAWPYYGQIVNINGAMYGWDETNARWTPLGVASDGSLSATVTNFDADTSIVPVTEWATQSISLTGGAAQTITSGITGSRRFIEIKSHTVGSVFWVDFGADAVVEACRPCEGYFYGEVPVGIDVSIIASTSFDLSVVEGGY